MQAKQDFFFKTQFLEFCFRKIFKTYRRIGGEQLIVMGAWLGRSFGNFTVLKVVIISKNLFLKIEHNNAMH